MALHPRQHHLAHFRQHLLVGPTTLANEMQQRLMLRRYPRRRRHRRHWLNALAFARQHQPRAIIPQRLGSIRMSNHAHKTLDISIKPRFTVASSWEIHFSLHVPKLESPQLFDSPEVVLRRSDSVVYSRLAISGLPEIGTIECASRLQPTCDLGFTRDRHHRVRKSATADLRSRFYPRSA